MSLEDVMTITPLGSGQEVGRSCHVLEFRNLTILLDCGIHPAYEGMNGLPFLDRIDPADVDAVLITHFHLDHAASLPYLTERTSFQGRVFMTHATKAVLRLLLGDYLRLLAMRSNSQGGGGGNANNGSGGSNDEILYTETDLQNCLSKIELIDYHETVTLGNTGLSFHALNAGHVLGACMYWLELGDSRSVLYTGDYSLEEDRHLMAAELPHHRGSGKPKRPDVLIVESTYGVQVHASRAEREARFTGTVERVVGRGGKCLIPVFALGRAQELLLILDDYWSANPHLQTIPVYYASKMASRALRVYQTYANMMNARIRAHMDIANPFRFQHIQNLKSIDDASYNENQPCVVFASPGMLQSGVSRQLFDRWAADPKNGVLIAGYAVEHTLAKEILHQPKEVVTLDGKRQPLNCLVDYVSFSAHVDFVQNRQFIAAVDPKHILLVHGQKEEMGRLKSALMLQYRQVSDPTKRPTITMPPNLQEVQLKFARRRQAKVMGQLATITTDTKEKGDHTSENDHANPTTSAQETAPAIVEDVQEGDPVQGILVTHNFSSQIVSPDDLATYTPLRVGSVHSTLHVPFVAPLSTLRVFINNMFANVTERTVPSASSVPSQQQRDVEGSNQDNSAMAPPPPTNPSSSSETTLEMDGAMETWTVFGWNDDQVTVSIRNDRRGGVATVSWEASPANDVIADAVVALLMHAQSSSAAIRMSSRPCCLPQRRQGGGQQEEEDGDNDDENHEDEPSTKKPKRTVAESRLRLIRDTLLDQFEDVEVVYDSTVQATYEIVTDCGLDSSPTTSAAVAAPTTTATAASSASGPASTATTKADEEGRLACSVTVLFDNEEGQTATIAVECADEKLAQHVQTCLHHLTVAAAPLSL